MRILYLYQYFTLPSGSWSTRAYEFSRRWVAAGDEVNVITSLYDKSGLSTVRPVQVVDIDGVNVRVIGMRLSQKHGKLMRLLTYFGFAFMGCIYALITPADVIFASSGPLTIGLPALLAHYVRRKPLVFEVRDLWPEGAIQLHMLRSPLAIRLARWLERRCYEAATTVVALSPGMAEDIRRRFPKVRVEVIPNASDNAFFGGEFAVEPLPAWTVGKHIALYTGSIGRMDDCGQIVRMAAELQAQEADDVLVVLIGDGNERAELEALAAAQGLNNIRFLGKMPKTEVRSWLRSATCALVTFKPVPVLNTCSPNKMFDALAAGVPVVQTTEGWIRRLLEEEGCGLSAPPEHPELFAMAVLSLARDVQKRETMSEKASDVARRLFDRDQLSTQLHALLQSACGRV